MKALGSYLANNATLNSLDLGVRELPSSSIAALLGETP